MWAAPIRSVFATAGIASTAMTLIRASEFIRSEEQLWWPIVRQDAAEDPRPVR